MRAVPTPIRVRAAAAVAPVRVRAAAALALAALAAAGCGAPSSSPLSGPAAEEVRASLDSGTASFHHREWEELLAGGVRGGLVDYRHFQRHRGELDRYLERVAAADLASLAPGHLKALLVNAYNAYTVRTILEYPAVSSIRDIDGVWTERTHTVGGHELTLDQIEHNLLRPFFRDPRIHFAVNCASLSCAPLPTWAFTGDSIGPQLEERTRAFLRDTANVRVEEGRLMLSRYFDWYGEDFTAEGWSPRAATIPLFVARYSRPEVAEFVSRHDGRPPVGFLPYDWSLNAAVAPDPGAAARPDPPDQGWVAGLRRRIDGLGPAAPVAYGLVYVVATVLLVPGSALTVGAGVAFGLLWGTVLVSLASVAGAAAAFLLARHFLRGRVERSIRGGIREGGEIPLLGPERSQKVWRFVDHADRALGRLGWRLVALVRLSPAFPFNLQNYAWGLTRVGFGEYVLASWAAMLPGTLLYVYLGAAGAQVAEAATGAADWGRTALQVAGLAATLGVVVAAGRIATRAVEEAAEAAPPGDRADAEPSRERDDAPPPGDREATPSPGAGGA